MRTPLAICALLSAVPAQTPITTPAGFQTTEGNLNFSFWGPNRRMQGLDATNLAGATWSSISFRRDGTAATNTYPTRTFDFEVKLGSVNWNLITNSFDGNYAAPPTTVYPMQPTNFPDWSAQPTPPPAPFNFTVMFNAPYTHAGGPFAWDIAMQNSTVTGLVVMDREYLAYASSTGTVLGAGCTATGRTSAFAHTAAARNGGVATGAFGMHLQVAATNAPASSPVFLMLDVTDANISVPFLCSTVHALAIPPFLIGQSEANGAFLATHLGFPYNSSLIGAALISQMLAPDAGQSPPLLPVVLSNARRSTMPNDPTSPSHAAAYIWATLPATSGTVFFGGCPIAQLQ